MLAAAAPHPLVSLRPQNISSYGHRHNHNQALSELKSRRVLGLVRPGASKLINHHHHTDSPRPLLQSPSVFCSSSPSNNNDDDDDTAVTPGIEFETKPVPSAKFGKLKAQKLKLIAIKAKQRLVTKHASSLQDEDDFGETLETEAGKDSIHVKDGDNKMSQGNEIMPNKPIKPYWKTGSRGWGKAVSKTTSIDPPLQPHRRKFFAENDFFSRKSFRDLGCTEFMIESLKGQLFFRPSHIQVFESQPALPVFKEMLALPVFKEMAMAFEPIIEGKSCVVADQSGSGKTLAYLTPLIQRLRQEELQGLDESLSQSPQVLIMVPTAELASQVLNNCRLMSKFGVPFRSMVATGGFRQRTQLQNLEQGVDVLIATPGRFKFLMEEGFLKLQNLKCVVLDEVDILFNDEDFEIALQGLINSSPVTTQYLFVTATLPVDIYNKLIEVFPDCEVIMGPGMHRTSARLEEILVDCSGENEMEKTPETAFLNKKSALLQLVEQSPVSKTIIFCNKIETCRKVENVLKRIDRKGTRVRVLPFHAALARESRLENMGDFMNPSQSEEESLFLVCTDRASRGIDFTGVDHVVLFDFPRDPSEYVRRVGRTARGARGQGKAFIFVVGKQVSLAKKIIERNRKGHPLHDVPSAYEKMSLKNIA